MKRPLAVVGFTMLASLLILCEADNIRFTVCVCVILLFISFLTLVMHKTKTAFVPTVFMSAAAVCLLLLCFENFYYEPSLSLCDKSASITATITDYPQLDGDRYHCTAKVNLPESKLKTGIRLSFAKSSYYDEDFSEKIASLEPGDTVSFQGNIYALGAGESQIMQSFKSKKMFLGAYPTGEVSISKAKSKSLLYFLKRTRHRTINELLSSFDTDTAGVGISVLMGEKRYLSDKLYTAFRNAGAAHIMAVSGLHLSVWILFIMRIVEHSYLDKRKWSIFLLCFTLIVMFFASFSGSVIRAGIMMIVYLLGFIIREESDALNSLGCCAIIILLANPFSAMNISFLLSFCATLSIILVSSPLCDKIDKVIESKIINTHLKKAVSYAVSIVIISVGVSLFTLPITLNVFGTFSVLFIITNLLILPVSSFLVIFFGLFVMFSFVPVLSSVLKFAAWAVSTYCCKIVCFISSLKFSTATFRSETVALICAFCACLYILLFLALKYKRKAFAAATAIVFVVSIGFSALFEIHERNDFVRITAYDVSNGLCVTISQGKMTALVFAESPDYDASFVPVDASLKTAVAILPDDSFNTKLISAFDPDCVAVASENDVNLLSADLRKSTVCCLEDYIFADVKISVNENIVYIEAYNTVTAITKGTKADGDIIITNNTDNILDYNGKSVIILSGEYPLENSFSTADNSDITVKISKDAGYCVKGENSWRYLMKSS